MVVFASPQWVKSLDDAARTVTVAVDTHLDTLRVTYELTDAPAGTGSYVVDLTPDGLTVSPGAAAAPAPGACQVTVTQAYEVAAAVGRGEIPAGAAVLDGRIRITGAVTALVAWQDTMTALDEALHQP